jgi:hypothetical protein
MWLLLGVVMGVVMGMVVVLLLLHGTPHRVLP